MNEIILEIRSLMEAALKKTYKKYFYGENKVPDQYTFPFLEVIPNSSSIDNRGTGGMKDNEFGITISIKNTLKKKITSFTDKEIISHIQDIVKKMEERNPDGTFKEDTVMGVLEDNLTLNAKANINGNWEISYDDFELDGSWIYIGTVTFTVSLITPK